MNLKTLSTCAALAFGSAAATQAAAPDDKPWRLDSSLNLFMAGLSGDVTAKGVPASIDASFSDVLDSLEAGAAGRFTLGYDRWFFSTEFSYLHLKGSVPGIDADFKQWLVEPTVGYSFCQYFAGFAGARYNNLDGDVTIKPLDRKLKTGTQDWWDPIVGGLFSAPLVADKLSFDGRFDVGGFGVGADLTWQAFPYINWRISKSASLQVGYRWLGTDYETGSGRNKFRYDVVVEGPQIGLTLQF